MYAKIKDNLLIQYPYDANEFTQDNPHTAFSGNVFSAFENTEANLRGETLVEVQVLSKPLYDEKLQNLVQATLPMCVDGNWVITWDVVAKTEEELQQQNVLKAEQVRSERKMKLSKSDYTQISDSPIQNKQDWAIYRQALRDVPQQSGFPWEVNWPTEP